MGLLALYYVIPLGVAISSLGEICPYSPAGTNLCASSSSSATVTVPSAPITRPRPSAGKLCTRSGIRYAGKTAQGAPVCLTLTRSSKAWVEIGYRFVAASGCPRGATGDVHLAGTEPSPLGASGRIEVAGSFTATISGGAASGVLGRSEICGNKKFTWSARRQP